MLGTMDTACLGLVVYPILITALCVELYFKSLISRVVFLDKVNLSLGGGGGGGFTQL